MKIYEIDEELRRLFEGVTNAMGDVDNVIINRVNDLVLAKEEKLLALAKYVREQKAEVEAMKDAEKDITTRRKRLEKRIDSASEYLLNNLDDKISDSFISVSKRKSEKIVLTDMDKFFAQEENREYVTECITKHPDKIKLKADIKAGVIVEGVELQESYSLQIK